MTDIKVDAKLEKAVIAATLRAALEERLPNAPQFTEHGWIAAVEAPSEKHTGILFKASAPEVLHELGVPLAVRSYITVAVKSTGAVVVDIFPPFGDHLRLRRKTPVSLRTRGVIDKIVNCAIETLANALQRRINERMNEIALEQCQARLEDFARASGKRPHPALGFALVDKPDHVVVTINARQLVHFDNLAHVLERMSDVLAEFQPEVQEEP